MKVNSAAPANTNIDKARGIHKGIWKLAAIDPKEMPTILVATEMSVMALINFFALHCTSFVFYIKRSYDIIVYFISFVKTNISFYGEL